MIDDLFPSGQLVDPPDILGEAKLVCCDGLVETAPVVALHLVQFGLGGGELGLLLGTM